MFDRIATVIFLCLMTVVIYITLFNGDPITLKSQALDKVPGLATTLSVMLPTASLPLPTNPPIPTRKPALPTPDIASVPVPSETPLPLCSMTADQSNCIQDPTPVIEQPVVEQPVFVVPAIDPETGQGNTALVATATQEAARATAAPAFEKPNLAQTCNQFIGCLGRKAAEANYQADCHAEYWARDGKIDTDKARACAATGDYR